MVKPSTLICLLSYSLRLHIAAKRRRRQSQAELQDRLIGMSDCLDQERLLRIVRAERLHDEVWGTRPWTRLVVTRRRAAIDTCRQRSQLTPRIAPARELEAVLT